jgi:hypothetical protein
MTLVRQHRSTRPSRTALPRVTASPSPYPGADPDVTSLATRLSHWSAVIAPTTVATAMLLYFGYIGTRARFAYFGVYLELTELSSRDLVLYGIEVLYLPVAILLLTVLAVVLIHLGASWATTRDQGRNGVLMAAGVVALIGVLLTARAVIGLLVGHVARAEPAASTPLAMATGPVLVAYACWLAARVGIHHDRAAPALRSWYLSRPVRTLRLTALTAAVGLAVTGLFWAGTSFAWRLGEGRAYDDALQLPSRPEVVLDTGQRLIDLPPFVQETKLPAGKGDRFHYRYRGLRLLIQAGDRLFLVPGQWTAQGRTLVVPYDDSIRLQVIPKPGG